MHYICITYRGVEQLVARWAHNPKVTGSSPVPATKTIKRLYFYSVAVFDLYLSMIARCNSFLSLTFAMS